MPALALPTWFLPGEEVFPVCLVDDIRVTVNVLQDTTLGVEHVPLRTAGAQGHDRVKDLFAAGLDHTHGHQDWGRDSGSGEPLDTRGSNVSLPRSDPRRRIGSSMSSTRMF